MQNIIPGASESQMKNRYKKLKQKEKLKWGKANHIASGCNFVFKRIKPRKKKKWIAVQFYLMSG